MLELGQTDSKPQDKLILDVDESSFMSEVIEASNSMPVIVDFWAPWCGPCKTLGPQLEAAVTGAKGAVKMAKVNVEDNQAIAGQMRVQSIPTVYAFWKGQPIDGFQGAVPASEVTQFVQRVVQASGVEVDGGLEDAVAAAEQFLADGAVDDAIQTFVAVLEENPNHAEAYSGLVRSHIALQDLEQAEAVLNGAPAEIAHTPQLESAFAQIELAKQALEAGPLDDLRNKLDFAPDDHQTRLDFAKALFGAGNTQEAVDELLELFRRDKDWNGGAAKDQLFTIFEALKPNDPVVLNGRRKLSSLIFA